MSPCWHSPSPWRSACRARRRGRRVRGPWSNCDRPPGASAGEMATKNTKRKNKEKGTRKTTFLSCPLYFSCLFVFFLANLFAFFASLLQPHFFSHSSFSTCSTTAFG